MQMDAETFADWGVDYLKFDGCYAGDWQFQGGMLLVYKASQLNKVVLGFKSEFGYNLAIDFSV
jgi:hypothetical protein